MNASKKFSTRNFLHIIFKRKNLILKFIALSLTVVALGSYLKKPEYIAIAKVLVKPGKENIYSNPGLVNGQSDSVFRFDAERQINSEIQILKSRTLIENVLNIFGMENVYPEISKEEKGVGSIFDSKSYQNIPAVKVMKFQKNLKVKGVRDSEVILIEFNYRNPDGAATILNTLIKTYLERRLQIHSEDHSQEFFGKQSQFLENQIAEMEVQIQEFKKTHSFTSLEEERSLLLKEVATLRAQFSTTSIQEKETKERVIQLKEQLKRVPVTISLDMETGSNQQTISALENRLIELELKQQELISSYTDKVPFKQQMLKNVEKEIQLIQKNLKKTRIANLGEKVRLGANTVHQQLQIELLRNEVDFKSLKEKKEAQEKQMRKYLTHLDKFNGLEIQYNDLRQRLGLARMSLQSYRNKFEESKMSAAMDQERISNVKVIEPAKPPLSSEEPHFFVKLTFSLLFGGVAGIGMAFFLEHLADSLQTEEDVENSLDLPSLGSINNECFVQAKY